MQFGISLRNFSKLSAAETVENLSAMGRDAEELGYDTLWVADHLVMPFGVEPRYPYNATGQFGHQPGDQFFEPLSVLAALAARTNRIRLGTGVLILPLRHPVLNAKMLATIDAISGGRLVLGVGAGWMREEFEASGAPSYKRRGSLTDEHLRIYRELWTNAEPSFGGEFYQLSGFTFQPKPVQRHVPIWVGGNTDAALRRAARLGDGWHALNLSLEDFHERLQRLREFCQAQGRELTDLAISMMYSLSIDMEGVVSSGPEAARVPRPDGSHVLVGTPQQLVASLRRFQDAGLQHFAAYPTIHGQETASGNFSTAMDIFAHEVAPALR